MLDRIDLHVEVPAVEYKTLSSRGSGRGFKFDSTTGGKKRTPSSVSVSPKEKGILANSQHAPRLSRKHCELDSEGAGFLEHAMTDQNFSGRAHDHILRNCLVKLD